MAASSTVFTWADWIKTWGALIIAVTALIAPGIGRFVKTYIRRGTVRIYQAGQIEFNFGIAGMTIALLGSLRAQDHDFFITSARVEVVKEEGGERHLLDWAFVRPLIIPVGVQQQQQGTLGIPVPFQLSAIVPQAYNLLFHDVSVINASSEAVAPFVHEWAQAKQGNTAGIPLATLYQTFSQAPIFQSTKARLEQLCYWETGRWRIKLTMTSEGPHRQFFQEWAFTMGQGDVDRLRHNVNKVLMDWCEQQGSGILLMVSRPYESVNRPLLA